MESPEIDRENPGIAYSWFVGPCPPGFDCGGFVQLMLDGTLRVDAIGEVPARLHGTIVTSEELDHILKLASNSALIDFVTAEAGCEGPILTDSVQDLFLNTDLVIGEAPVCPEVMETGVLAKALQDLADEYFPR